MRIGIIEICIEGHYVVVHALIKTYLSDENNEVIVFTTPSIKALLEAQNDDPRLSFVVMTEQMSAGVFIELMNSYMLDRIHYTTVAKYFREFYRFDPNPGCAEYFHFHNIDLWFMSAFKLQAKRILEVMRNYNSSVNLFNHVKYSIKDIFRDYYRKKFIKKIIWKNINFILLSGAQRKYLALFVADLRSVIFPSLIFENEELLVHTTVHAAKDKIRVCVPGAVIQAKKEYDKFLLVLESNLEFYRQHYIFDLLGKVSDEEKLLLGRIGELEKQGLEIYYYRSFIDVNEFDRRLYESDIILSNMLMSDGDGIQNKETAAVYQMIRGAKPGIFPSYFILDDHFRESVVKFSDYGTLHDIFRDLMEKSDKLANLQEQAREVSRDFTPTNLLKRLIP